jgi:hypothetical protein
MGSPASREPRDPAGVQLRLRLKGVRHQGVGREQRQGVFAPALSNKHLLVQRQCRTG